MPNALQNLQSWMVDHIHLLEGEPRATMTAGQITRLSWARPIRSFDEMPPFYQPRFREIVGDPAHFPHTVLAPTFEGFLHREMERLIFNVEEKIFILEKRRNTLVETSFWLPQINYIELGQVLLKAWMRVNGISEREELESKSLKFNTVTTVLFQPYIEMLRCPIPASGVYNASLERDKFRKLEPESFKFMNFGRRSLQAGEHLEQFIFQPEVRRPMVKIGRRVVLSKSLCLAHLTILTDQELVLVRDDPESQSISQDVYYGGIWIYIPLHRLQRVQIEEGMPGMIELRLEMPGGDQLEIPFEVERSEAVRTLMRRIGDLTRLESV
jgi:hypothetical protein